MDDIHNDLEAGISSNIPRNSNKKIRKRKQLDSLLKFRVKKTNSNDILRSSEDELFLPQPKPSITKLRSSRCDHCWKYSQHILSFVLVCIFIIACVGLIYANIQLKTEVQNLTLRLNQIENKPSNMKLNNILSTIEQLKVRLNFLEHWNYSLIYDQLQKLQIQMLINDNDVISSKHRSTRFPKLTNKSNQQSENMINGSTGEWEDQLRSFKNNIQSTEVQQLMVHLEQLTNLLLSSSDKTSGILTDFDKLRSKIDECKCSKESTYLKPSVVDTEHLQQIILTKPIISTSFEKLSNENKQIENDVEEIVNGSPPIG